MIRCIFNKLNLVLEYYYSTTARRGRGVPIGLTPSARQWQDPYIASLIAFLPTPCGATFLQNTHVRIRQPFCSRTWPAWACPAPRRYTTKFRGDPNRSTSVIYRFDGFHKFNNTAVAYNHEFKTSSRRRTVVASAEAHRLEEAAALSPWQSKIFDPGGCVL